MKTLRDNVIVYDAECPMCKLYTGAFVKTGMLEVNGREAYTGMDPAIASIIDLQRAKNEIALIDRKNHTVTYGIDSLFKIVGNSWPLLQPLLRFTVFHWVMKKIYFFISYNRKVIVPGQEFESVNACTPDLNLYYRWVYILFTWLFTSFILSGYASLLQPLVPSGSFSREFLLCGGQIVFQSLTVYLDRKDRIIHYLGNMMTVSFAGGLLLLPSFLLSAFGVVTSPYFFLGWFALVVGLMFLEHIRRVKLLGLSGRVTAGWVLYRIILLVIIYTS